MVPARLLNVLHMSHESADSRRADGRQAGKPDVRTGKPDVRESYRRHLPHQIPKGYPIFLTWNLKDSLPQRVLRQLDQERKQLEQEPRAVGETELQRQLRHGKILFSQRGARDEAECVRIIAYIERNPVEAELCPTAEQWPWSSAALRQRFGWLVGQPFQAQWKDRLRGL